MATASPVPARLDEALRRLFGAPTDPITEVAARARAMYPGLVAVVWEGDPTTFQFEYVSEGAEAVLGYPAARWTREARFWVEQVVHPDDRHDAVAYCALATALGRDHTFEYRAIGIDGRVYWLRDLVHVVLGPRGVPVKLRGVMFDVTAEKAVTAGPAQQEPSVAELRALQDARD